MLCKGSQDAFSFSYLSRAYAPRFAAGRSKKKGIFEIKRKWVVCLFIAGWNRSEHGRIADENSVVPGVGRRVPDIFAQNLDDHKTDNDSETDQDQVFSSL